MPNVSQTIRFRRQRYAREIRRPFLKIGLLAAVLFSLFIVLLSITLVWYVINLTANLPSVALLPTLLDPPNGQLLQPTQLLDRTGGHVLLTLENPAAAGQQYIYVAPNGQPGVDQAPVYLVNAAILEFEPNFWHNPGFSLSGIDQGTHATLAQLLVSELVLDSEPPSIQRNIRERIQAAGLTARFGRQKVLEWYLNSAQFGLTTYGADAAARIYFGKPAAKLSLAQSAMLIAMAENPSIDPRSGSRILDEQQQLIIQKMLVTGLITGVEAQQALKEPIGFADEQVSQPLAPAFTALVLEQLSRVIPLDHLYRGGYTITTSLDYDLQLQADCAMQAQLMRYQGSQEAAVTTDGTPCETSGLLPAIQDSSSVSAASLGAEVVMIDPQSGQILAMLGKGGSGFLPSDPETHPAGSILTPFLYLSSFTHGMGPASLLWDVPTPAGNSNSALGGASFIPPTSYHGPVSLREAFINDYPAATASVLQQEGAKNVWQTESHFGIRMPDTGTVDYASLDGFYSQNVSLLESVQAYAVLANQGIMAGIENSDPASSSVQEGLSPISILKVQNTAGQVFVDWAKPKLIPIANQQVTYLLTNMLSDEQARWTSLGHPNGLEINRPAAVRLSLTPGSDSAWVVGYIPQLAVGVWMGNDQRNSNRLSTELPAGLWHAVMMYAADKMEAQDFMIPPGIKQVQVCEPSGLLVTDLCPEVVREVFLDTNVPVQADDLYQRYLIDRETGLLATIFTPSDLVEEKIFLKFPAEAETWAKAAGFAIPPDRYDNLPLPPPAQDEVKFSTPVNFTYVAGKVIFTGNAGGEDFAYYRLEVGQGLFPQQWLQVGEDINTPVKNGTLGAWDTTGLEGMYVVKLLVVRQDKRIDQAVLQVTVDNTPPKLQIIAPQAGEQFTYHAEDSLVLNIAADDNLVLERVEFILDGALVRTLPEPPYIVLWDARIGNHTLLVRAYDLAGNLTTSSLAFVVQR